MKNSARDKEALAEAARTIAGWEGNDVRVGHLVQAEHLSRVLRIASAEGARPLLDPGAGSTQHAALSPSRGPGHAAPEAPYLSSWTMPAQHATSARPAARQPITMGTVSLLSNRGVPKALGTAGGEGEAQSPSPSSHAAGLGFCSQEPRLP